MVDWILEHAPWLGMALIAFIKLIQDHFMIKDHHKRIKDLEDRREVADIERAETRKDIKHIRHTVDAMAYKQNVTDDDIKRLIAQKANRDNVE